MIETSRCTLRAPKLDDIEKTIRFYELNREHLAPWDPAVPEGFYTPAYWKQKFEEAQSEFKDKSMRLHLFLKDGTLIGMTNFTNFERGPFQNCRLGYKIGKQYEGKGYMFEALQAAIQIIFEKDLNFHRIEANYIPSNHRSAKLLKRLGFTEHGIAERYLHINGQWMPHVLTSLVNKAWESTVV